MTPVAMVFLGGLLAEQGDLARARAAYEEAVASRHPEMRPAGAKAFDRGARAAPPARQGRAWVLGLRQYRDHRPCLSGRPPVKLGLFLLSEGAKRPKAGGR